MSSQINCTCGDETCRQKMYLTANTGEPWAELTVYSANGDSLFYLDQRELIHLSIEAAKVAMEVNSITYPDRMWSVLRLVRNHLDTPPEKRNFSDEDHIWVELNALIKLHEEGKL